jgi:DNA-directed RNA polymerase subunit RPC12/RpoP
VIPIIDGWELVSTFDITPRVPVKNEIGGYETDEDGNTLYAERMVFTSTVPGRDLPWKFQDKNEIHCDHCGHRRFRTHSMLMRKVNTMEYKEVGSTCVKDFFGHDPKGLLWMAQLSFSAFVREDEDEYLSGGSGSYLMHLDTLLQWTAMAIRLDGWVSRKFSRDYGKLSTVDSMYFYMDEKNHEKFGTPSDEDIKLSNDTIKHFIQLDQGDNDYLANCCKVVKLGYVPDKMVGVACSMISSYKLAYKERIERESRPESNWIGELKDKVEIDVKCVWSKEFQGDWGTNVLYIFVDDSTGNKFKTFYSGSKWTVYQGDTMTLKGTVKGHDTYRDEKSTNLTRCSVSNLVEAKEEPKDV